MNTVVRKEQTQKAIIAVSVWCLCALVLALAVAYVGLVNRAVVHAAVRQDVVKEIQKLELSLAQNEAAYAQLTQSLTRTVAFDKGLIEEPTSRFVQRLPAQPTVTLNTVR